ncbi:NAD(P)-dependent oxidoreductase [Microlunatus spumicola]|uniref:NAD(P)-dependent oxidoreductase n=1 Tax=Microlunatus spumicola TaxID=81499 RepID=A0ABP6XH67_9ACTN
MADVPPDGPVGFVGLGVMGQPMALNLARAGTSLVVWNRTPERAEPLRAAGAVVAADVEEVFDRARTVVLMLVGEAVLDAVLQRGTPGFARLVRDHLVVSTASNSPAHSRALAADVAAAGGRYVEAPVSGSRRPAEAGALVALLGGDPDDVAEVRGVLAPTCRAQLDCGGVGSGLMMKLAVNVYLDVTMAGLAEAVHFADRQGLDLTTFGAAIDAGQMASDLTRVKVPKLVAHEFGVQAATEDAYANARLIAAEARAAGLATPLLDAAAALYGESVDLGHARDDMSSVLSAIEARTDAEPGPPV